MREIYERFAEKFDEYTRHGIPPEQAAEWSYEDCEADAADREAYMIDKARELA